MRWSAHGENGKKNTMIKIIKRHDQKIIKHNGSGRSSLQGTSAGAGDSAHWLPQKLPKSTQSSENIILFSKNCKKKSQNRNNKKNIQQQDTLSNYLSRQTPDILEENGKQNVNCTKQ